MFGVSENTENTAVAGEQVEQVAGEGFKAPESQAELDRIIQARLGRVHEKYADYDEVKSKAEKAAELEATAAELRKRVEAFESRDARIELVRKVAADNSVDAELLAEMRGDSEDELIAQAKRLAERIKPAHSVIPGQAKSPESTPGDESRDFMRKLLNKEA